jgi:hypothetical protein
MDASVARAASNVANPVAAHEANLVAGARLYHKHCTLCHGHLEYPKSLLADLLNPPPPQFMNDQVADMPENQNFYILQRGIRWTAMPRWKKVLSAQRMWQVVTFLSQMHDLPPAAKYVFAEQPIMNIAYKSQTPRNIQQCEYARNVPGATFTCSATRPVSDIENRVEFRFCPSGTMLSMFWDRWRERGLRQQSPGCLRI